MYSCHPQVAPCPRTVFRKCLMAGLPELRFHDLRHTFATLALQSGVDVKTVSGMLGHFSAGFTLDTYAHVTSEIEYRCETQSA